MGSQKNIPDNKIAQKKYHAQQEKIFCIKGNPHQNRPSLHLIY